MTIPQEIMHDMHGIISYLLDCFADPFVRLLVGNKELYALGR